MENAESRPVLRVCIPDDTSPEGAQCYNVCFKDDAQIKQAITALYSTGRSSWSSDESSPASSNRTSPTTHVSEASTRASSIDSMDDLHADKPASPEALTVNSEEAQVLADRQEALEFLEGTKKPIPNRDWGNSDNAVHFDVFAWWDDLVEEEKQEKQKRERPELAVKKPDYGPTFSWCALCRVLRSQIPVLDLDVFPKEDEELEPTLLFLKQEEDGVSEEVHCRASLLGKSVGFFEALMLDVEMRGWMDVLWLGRPGEELPDEVKQRGVGLLWGESMI